MLEGTFSNYMNVNVNVQCTSMSKLENTNREPEELEGGVQQLAGLELHGVGEGDAEDQEVQGEVGGEDGQDVELVSRVVVVQVVPRLAVSQPELVPQPETLDMSSVMKYLMYIISGDSCEVVIPLTLEDWQLLTAMNHHRSRAVLKFLDPRHRITVELSYGTKWRLQPL